MLDWEDITKAPVWDEHTGFGGNGNVSIEESTMQGHCVDTGPFANLEVLYLGAKSDRHCLSRGFESEETLAEEGRKLRPQALDDLLEMTVYNTFNLGLENGPHSAIPYSVRGDFSLFTAPYGWFSPIGVPGPIESF